MTNHQSQVTVRKINEGSKIQLSPLPSELGEAERVITVRMPASLHEALRAEAHGQHTSMNQLAVAKLNFGVDWSKFGDPVIVKGQVVTKPEEPGAK
jgi:predicted HicB family RNase H-like nuclease